MKLDATIWGSLWLCCLAGGCGDDAVAADGGSTTADGSTSASSTETPTTQAPTTETLDPGSTSTAADDDGSSTRTGSTSESSGEETGSPDRTPPSVVIATPRPGAGVSSRLWTFEGTVTDDVSVASLVFAGPNGDEAVEVMDDGSFSHRVTLQPGEHAYTFVGEDGAGNQGEVSVPVHFGHRTSVGNSQGAFLRDGVLWTWGRNELGQLGNGTLEGSGWGDEPETAELPVRYAIDVDGLLSVVNRQTFMLGLREDGTVLSWGSNASRQLGRETAADCGSGGTSPCGRSPAPVPGVDQAVAIGAGFGHALVLREDGSVWTFGDNGYGQLGADTGGEPRLAAGVVEGLTGIIQVAAASDASYALAEGGTVYAWGENDRGQLGRGTADDVAHPDPQAVLGLEDVVQVAAANTTAFALLADGTVRAWGRNHAGQAGIGDDTGADVMSPTVVVTADGMPLGGVVSVAGDGFVGLAVTDDGVAYAWGLGSLGQLGQGFLEGGERDLGNRVYASPVAVEDDDVEVFDILELEGGAGGPSLALSVDGHLFGWGWSFRGSLGLEGAINAWAYTAPVLVFAAD